jgi:hypothetical protein
MNYIQFLCITAIYVGFGAMEIATGRYKNWGAAKDDWKIESMMLVLLLIVIQPLILFGVYQLGQHYFPGLGMPALHCRGGGCS